MKKNIFIQSRTIFIPLLMIVFSVNLTYSQDGTNFDFAYGTPGNYAGWIGKQSQNNSSSTTISFSAWTTFNDPATCTWQGSNCFVINSDINQSDFTVPALKRIPPGYSRSTQINCAQNNRNSNMLTYDILLNDTNCLLTFNYALVFENPGHSGYQNPFFKIEVQRLNAAEQEIGLIDPGATFVVFGDNYPVPSSWGTFSGGIWQNWRQISMNLTSYQSEKVRIKVIVASCQPSGHWAYGYFVGRVGPSVLTVNACGNGDTVATITAPSGFQKYEWFKAQSAGMTESAMAAASLVNPVLFQSTATALVPAINNFNILNAMYAANGQNYFVKVTSPSSNSNVPGCVAYMTVTAQTIKPVTGFSYFADCQLRAIFTNQTTFPVDDSNVIKEYYWDFGDNSTAYYASDDTITNGNVSPVHQYAAPGTYPVILKAVYNGCESIVNLNLVLNPIYNDTITAIICNGETYNQFGFNENTTGLYTQNLQTINGCDSIVNLSLIVNPIYNDTIHAEICSNEIYTLNGFNVNTTGFYTQSFQTINGCDSIVNLSLTVNQPAITNLTVEICQGEVYTLNGFNVSTAGLHTLNLQTNKGCDSIVNLNLVVNQPAITNLTAEICQGETYILNGFNVSTAGLHTLNLQTTKGCDSTVNLTLIVIQTSITNLTVEICQGDVYTLNGFNTSIAGIHTQNLQTVKGCDSIVNLTLIVNPVYLVSYLDNICKGYEYNNYGFNFIADTSGVYTRNYQTINGCDSVFVLNLVVNPTPIVPEDLNVQVMTNFIEITWQSNGSSYIIYRNNDSLTTVNQPIYLDYNVVNGQPYCYKVKAIIEDCESEFSNVVCKSFSGLNDISSSNITTKLYPNPTNNKAKLEVEGLSSEAEVLVSDMIGRVVQMHKINKGKNELEIDLSGYAKGVYSIRIMNDSINQTKKLIVQ